MATSKAIGIHPPLHVGTRAPFRTVDACVLCVSVFCFCKGPGVFGATTPSRGGLKSISVWFLGRFEFLPKINFHKSSSIDRMEGYCRKVQPTYIASTCFLSVFVFLFLFYVRVLGKFFFSFGYIYICTKELKRWPHRLCIKVL